MTFVLQREKLNQRCFMIFEALDQDASETADYFKERTAGIDPQALISLRDVRVGNEGRTLLHNAARKGSLSVVLSLIRSEHKVDVYDSCVSRITPLMDAIMNLQVEVAIVLIEAGAELSTEDVNGENALHYCARSGNCRLLRNIISASGYSRFQIMQVASKKSIKKLLPEDVAKSSMAKEILIGLREEGHHAPVFSKVIDTSSFDA
jgi:hypothetical protein